jgi:hypothetical protein
VQQKRSQDEQEIAELVAKGEKPIKLVYHDGGSHDSFRTALAGAMGADGSLVVDSRMRNKFGDVSRPEGLSSGPQEIALDDSGRATTPEAPSTALAFASMNQAPAAPAPVAAVAAPQTKVAAAAPAPVAAPVQQAALAQVAAGSQETPFYKKMFTNVGDLFSTAPAPQPEAETAQVAAPVAAPSRAPPAKPQAPAASQKRAQAPAKVNVAAAH